MLTGGGATACIMLCFPDNHRYRPLFVPWFAETIRVWVQQPNLSRRALSLGIGSGAAAAGIRASHITHPAHAAPAEPCPNVLEQ